VFCIKKRCQNRNVNKSFSYTELSVPDHWSDMVTVYLFFTNVSRDIFLKISLYL